MVFESIVADLLNRFVGEYVENLDKTQLKIGIWGGDVVLHDLIIKDSVLNELDLPLTIAYARLGKLVLKIPWKEIYSAPAEALIERLYVLAVPNQSVEYNAEKAEKKLLEWKRDQITKYELGQRQSSEDKGSLDKTFTERLCAQIINNVQIKIKDIHIRYEDTITSSIPFAIGATLSSLSVHTTNEDWQECLVTGNVSKIFKIAKQEGLAIYLNPNCDLFLKRKTNEYDQLFKESIATSNQQPPAYNYILGPINLISKLTLNSNPESDDVPFSIPKIELNVNMESLSLGITKSQYKNLTQLVESVGRMVRGAPYQKYRPSLSKYRGHFKEWWHFAYNCILNTEVKRKRKNWSWDNMIFYRKCCKDYAEAHQSKMLARKPPADLIKKCEDLESKLHMANIVQIRQTVEVEVKRLGKLQQSEDKGWISWMFGSKKKSNAVDDESDIKSKFEAAMTSEEKAKLYHAIGYEEDSVPQEFPSHFVATVLKFELNALEIKVKNDTLNDDDRTKEINDDILFLQLKGVLCNLYQRPAAAAVKLELQMNDFKVEGVKQKSFKPALVLSDLDPSLILLNLIFETNPMDKGCDQRLQVSSRPLQIIYDAETIIQLLAVFTTPQTTTISKLQDVAAEKLSNIKERSATGLQYTISKHSKLDLDVNIMPSYIVIPYNGIYQKKESVIVLSLGKFLIKSEPGNKNRMTDVRAMHDAGKQQQEIVAQILSQSYDEFVFEIQDFQAIVAKPSDDWLSAIQINNETGLHLLNPTTLKVSFQLCLIDDDPRLPRAKIAGEIPSLSISMSDERVLDVFSILTSIPLPGTEVEAPVPIAKASPKFSSSLSLLKYLDDKQKVYNRPRSETVDPDYTIEQTQFTDFDVCFALNELCITFDKDQREASCETFATPTGECPSDSVVDIIIDDSVKTDIASTRIFCCKVKQVEMNIIQKTYEMKIDIRLGAVSVTQHRKSNSELEILDVISTPKYDSSADYLFELNYLNCKKFSPEFNSKYGSVEQFINIRFSTLLILLHQQGITELIEILNNMQSKVTYVIEQSSRAKEQTRVVTQQEPKTTILINAAKSKLPVISEDHPSVEVDPVIVDSIKLKITAKFEDFAVELQNESSSIAVLEVKNLTAQATIKTAYTDVSLKLQDIIVTDRNPFSLHSNILSIVGENAISCQVIIYNVKATSGYNTDDFKIDISMGCAKIVFLNLFVTSVLDFLDNFQMAQQKIRDASVAAAEAAKTNVVEAYTQATRMKLNIKIKAPIIIIPIDSKTLEAIAIDLGHLSVVNRYHIITVKNELRPAVIDEMNVELNDMKLLRVSVCQMDETDKGSRFGTEELSYGIQQDSQILFPTSFVLTIKRNLTSDWYKEQSQLNIFGRIDTIELSITSDDYKIIMKILEKNMNEVDPNRVSPIALAVDTRQSLPEPKKVNDRQSQKIIQDKIENKQVIEAFLKFSFELNRVLIHLNSSPTEGLATFRLNYLSVKGQRLSDGCLTTSVILCDVHLDDDRLNRENKITRFIEKRTVGDNSNDMSRSMIDITLTIKEDDTFADVKVYSFDLIISIDFLLRISKFFETSDVVEVNSKHPATKAKIQTAQAVQVHEDIPLKSFTLNLHIEQPDVILVESLDDLDCYALILNSELFLKLKTVGLQQQIKGEIKHLCLYISEFNPEVRYTSKYYVIRPCDLSLNGSTADTEEKGLNVALMTSNIKISVSPYTIQLLNTIMTTLTYKEDTVLEENATEIDYTELWEEKPFKDNDHWFTSIDESEEAVMLEAIEYTKQQSETCIVEIPSIIFVIESGLGIHTIPLLSMEMKLNSEIRNWTSEMELTGTLSFLMSYFNNNIAIWEPMIEPIEKELLNGDSEYNQWKLDFCVEVDANKEDASIAEPTTKISITSTETLELTFTETSLDVLQNLSNAFSEAIKPSGIQKTEVMAPYVLRNDTGWPIVINLEKSGFCLLQSGEDYEECDGICTVSTNSFIYLQPSSNAESMSSFSFMQNTMLEKSKNVKEKNLFITIGENSKELALPVDKADFRYFPLYRESKEPIAIISEVKITLTSITVTIRGILQIFNHFNIPITIHGKNDDYFTIGEVQPTCTFNIPLSATYSEKNDVYFSMKGYRPSAQGISWKEHSGNHSLNKSIQCDPLQTYEPFFINVIKEREDAFHEVTSKYTMTSASFIIHLRPPLTLRNCLPIPIKISVLGSSFSKEKAIASIDSSKTSSGDDYLDYGEKLIEPGGNLHLPTVKTSSKQKDVQTYIVVKLNQYLEKDWSCTTEICANPPEYSVWTFSSYDSAESVSLQLGVRYENQNNGLSFTLYCPFWFINKTGLLLSYRATDDQSNVLYHPPYFHQPIMFSFKEKAFFGKKKATIRVGNGEWCDKFSLDVAGSSGVILCKNMGMVYRITVRNILTNNSLTKQIVFMPYFTIFNRAPFTIELKETNASEDVWLKVQPEDCAPFWPKVDGNETLKVRIENLKEITEPFKYTEAQCTLLRLYNKYGGINVDVHLTESAVYLTFTNYFDGDAPALIINGLDLPITLWEKGNVNKREIQPRSKMLYTWADPAGERTLMWKNGQKNDIENDLRRDGIDHFKQSNSQDAFWISFLDGTQRILLFTDNPAVASATQATTRFEKFSQEISINIHGVGFSLVNRFSQKDIMYLGIASTGIIWQESKKNRWKPFKTNDSAIIEKQYQEWVLEPEKFTSGIGLDFEQMKFREKVIRRSFSPAVWLNIRTSPYQLQLHAKINRIQIDNQLSDCIYPVLLAPIPPPKSVANTEIKPFIEMSVVQRIIPHSNVKQFKYLRVLIQEFHLKVDLIFINEIFAMLSPNVTEEEAKRMFLEDLKLQEQPLLAHAIVQSQREQKHFYDNLHLGPLKIHVSFSMAGSESSALPSILSTILQGIGITLTDVNDVVFRLAYFQRDYQFLTQPQLVSECVSHYTSQGLKQLYVLVLGLDVIGNPYGLVIGFTKGVEDLFYEPFQGAIQGPGEFAEGLVLGVRSLFGHTVGGAAGAVSKITGAVGKGIAALTFDKEYQKKRRDQLNRKPANFQEGLARGGKGLVMGVFDGVTGVITKPISGAKSEGMEGFFKGLGKGAVGLIARPTAGFVDFASGSFDAVKRATDLSGEANRLRPPRFVHSDGILRPYSRKEAEGNKLLKEIDKGQFAISDKFECLESEQRNIFLLTNHRIICGIKNDLFGGWQSEWSFKWDQISSARSVEKGIEILLVPSNEGKFKFFSNKDSGKRLLPMENHHKREKLVKLITKLISNYKDITMK